MKGDKRTQRNILLTVVPLLLTLVLGTTVLAATFQQGGTNSFIETEETPGDLFVGGHIVTLANPVHGDVFAAGERVTANAPVEGSLHAGARYVMLESNVIGSARVFAQQIALNGQVGRDLVGIGQDVRLHADSRVGGDGYLFGDLIVVDGTVGDDLHASGDVIRINGQVNGDATLRAGTIVIAETAVINGDLRYASGTTPQIDPAAKISGQIRALEPSPDVNEEPTLLRQIWGKSLNWLRALLVAALLFLVWPFLPNRIRRSMHEAWWRPGVMGIVALIVVPVVAILVMVSVVGLPLGALALWVYAGMFYLAQIFVGSWIGQEGLRLAGRTGEGFWYHLMAVGVGLAAVRLLSAIPYVGTFFGVVTFIVGFGLLSLAVWPRRKAEIIS